MDPASIIQLIILFLLIMLSAFFSSAETSLTTVNKLKIRSLAEDGDKRAIILMKVTSNSSKMLSAILIGNNIVNISASSLATIFTQSIFSNSAVSLSTGILTLVILVFGEITPKTTATLYSENMALTYARVVYALMWLLTPVIFFINLLSSIVLKLLHINPDAKTVTITEGELRTIVDVSHEEGVIESEEREMIKNVFDFGDAQAKDVMIPRIDMTLISADCTYDELIDSFKINRYTRIPVYEDSTDNIIGIINMKDVLLYNQNEVFDLKKYIRPASYTYEYKNLSELMFEMRKAAVNIIIVLDEYGAAVGMITLEDLLEEIVGEIQDEYDFDEEDDFKEITPTEYIVDGLMKIDDFDDITGLNLTSDDYDSLGGYIMEKLDRLATIGDVYEDDTVKMIVESMDKNRINKIHVFVLSTILAPDTKNSK